MIKSLDIDYQQEYFLLYLKENKYTEIPFIDFLEWLFYVDEKIYKYLKKHKIGGFTRCVEEMDSLSYPLVERLEQFITECEQVDPGFLEGISISI